MTPKISVVLPVHNGARFLAESIESVLAQTECSLELIIMDDASTDATPQIIAEYAKQDVRVRAFRNERNLNLPNNLNAGFTRARGEYRTWTSDDNAYYPAALATLAAELDKNAEIGLVFSNFFIEDEFAGAKKLRHSPKLNHPERLVPHTNTVGACFLYRRSVAAQTHGYDDDFRVVEDYEYWLRLYLRTEFKYVNEALYKYRMHADSISGRLEAEKSGRAEYLTGKMHVHYLPALKASPKVGRRALSMVFLRIAKRMRENTAFYLKEAFMAYPFIVLRGLEKKIAPY